MRERRYQNLDRWRADHPDKARELGRIRGPLNLGSTFVGTGKIAAGRGNIHEKDWSIISPSCEVFNFINLEEFIRTHADLFDASDLIRKTRTGGTNAATQIAKLRPKPNNRHKSWKGWTWNGSETP